MSPRGYPDYTVPVTQITTEGWAGFEELAARLGSIVPWDLRGNIVLMDDFEAELVDWEDVSSGGTCAVTRSSRHKFSGDWSLKVYNPGDDACDTALERWFKYPGALKYALFARVHLDQDSQQIYLSASFWTGAQLIEAVVLYDPKDTLLEIQSDLPGFQTIDADLALVEDYEAWFPLLVTFDLETGYYDKLYFAHKEYDISTHRLRTYVNIATPVAKIEIGAYSYVAGEFSAYFDDIILAKNVP